MTTITWQSITATAASLKPVKNDKNRAAVKTRQSDTPPSDRQCNEWEQQLGRKQAQRTMQ